MAGPVGYQTLGPYQGLALYYVANEWESWAFFIGLSMLFVNYMVDVLGCPRSFFFIRFLGDIEFNVVTETHGEKGCGHFRQLPFSYQASFFRLSWFDYQRGFWKWAVLCQSKWSNQQQSHNHNTNTLGQFLLSFWMRGPLQVACFGRNHHIWVSGTEGPSLIYHPSVMALSTCHFCGKVRTMEGR